jgi:uncharacterized protein YecT (DUF1311 family)
MRSRIVLLLTVLFVYGCGQSGAPSTTVPAAPPPSVTPAKVTPVLDAAQQAMSRLDGRWMADSTPMELHYNQGRLLGRGAPYAHIGNELFVIAPAGEVDEANNQLPVTLTPLLGSCQNYILGDVNSFRSGLEERFEASKRLIDSIDNRRSNATDPVHYRAEILADLPELTRDIAAERDDVIGRCHPSPRAITAMTLKNFSKDPANTVLPGFVQDSGAVTKLSFIRKLTAAESEDIEHLHAINSEWVTQEDQQVAAKLQKYYDGVIATINRFHDQGGVARTEPPVAQSAAQPAGTAGTPVVAPSPSVEAQANVGSNANGSSSGKPVTPSFDCAKAGSLVEKMICGDPALAKADSDLASSYARAKAGGTDAASLRASQRQFLQARNSCTVSACVADSYHSREAELAQLAVNR